MNSSYQMNESWSMDNVMSNKTETKKIIKFKFQDYVK